MAKEDDELIALASAELTVEHITDFEQEIAREHNDRGAAILISAHLETSLEYALERSLKIQPGVRKYAFQNQGPLAEFSGKITMAFAIGLIGPETRRTLDKVRRIRNAFAHARVPINFSTPAVAKVCYLLPIPQLLPPMTSGANEINQSIEGRERFNQVCQRTAHNLLVAAGFYILIAGAQRHVQNQKTLQSLP